MCHKVNWMFLAAAMVLAAGIAQAVTIDVVPVGDPGNAGELSGEGTAAMGRTASAGPSATPTTSASTR